MAVNLSPVGGVAGQFFDNNGDPLVGGKLFTYAAGTTTPQVTYTSSSGATPNSNPIILNAGGRVPSEIWLTDGLVYKFVLYSSTDQLIGSWDNIVGINSNFVNFVTSEEVQIATAGQTVFTLTTMSYQPGINNLVVYVDGVNQVEGGSYSFVETNSTTVTFTSGLHLGAVVKFVSAETVTTIGSNAAAVAYEPAGAGAVTTTVQAKLRETVSVKDFGAVGDGVTDDTAAIQAATDFAVGKAVYFPGGHTYLIDQSRIDWTSSDTAWVGDGWGSKILWNPAADTPVDNWGMLNIHGTNVAVISKVSIRNLYFDFGRDKTSTYNGFERGIHIFNCNDIEIIGCYFKGAAGEMVGINNRGTGGCQRVLVCQNIFEDYPQNGLNPNGLYQTITGNIFRNAGAGSKIEIGGQYWVFTGNIVNEHNIGLDLSNASDFVVDGNSFFNVKTGIQFSNQTVGFASYRGVISNNTFKTASTVLGEYGILVQRGAGGVDNTEINVVGNTVTGYYTGIRVTSNIYGNVVGNIVDGSTSGNAGIEIGSSGGSSIFANLNGNTSVRNTTDYNIAALSSGEIVIGTNTSTNGQFTAANTVDSTANQINLTGSTSETDLKTVTVGGGTLPTGQGLIVKAVGETLGTAGNKTIRLYFHNQLVATIPAFATASPYQIEATMWSVSSAIQSWNVKAYVGTTLVLNTVNATTVTTTSNQDIRVTGELANATDNILQYGMTVTKF